MQIRRRAEKERVWIQHQAETAWDQNVTGEAWPSSGVLGSPPPGSHNTTACLVITALPGTASGLILTWVEALASKERDLHPWNLHKPLVGLRAQLQAQDSEAETCNYWNRMSSEDTLTLKSRCHEWYLGSVRDSASITMMANNWGTFLMPLLDLHMHIC